MENNGWIKLHRKVLDNGILKDQMAWTIFSWLMLKVDRTTGKKTTGRFWASTELGIKPTTFYRGLKRLEKKWKVVTLQVTGKATEISLINWNKYQHDNTSSNTSVTHRSHISDTLQEGKKKRIKNITNVIVKTDKSNPDINEVAKYFLEVMQIPKEDCTQRQSRQYWHLLLKESKTGVKGVKWLVDQVKKDEFLAPNTTSSKDLYYKRVKVIARQRGSRPKIAIQREAVVQDGQKMLENNYRN